MTKRSSRPNTKRSGKRPKVPKRCQPTVHRYMSEFKRGAMHSGANGPVVRSRDQALAIALSKARKHCGK